MPAHAPLPEEIELKLALGAEAVPALLALPVLSAQSPVTHVMRNDYFDTPSRALESARMALRLRSFDDNIVQTLKTAGQGSGGLHRRGEWEWPRDIAQLDTLVLHTLAQAQGSAHAALFCLADSQVLSQLQPVYTTDFTRRTWQVSCDDSIIEVALDEGHIQVEHARRPIFELELELKHGKADALWQLADTIAMHVPLRPANASKAQRAVALEKRTQQATPEAGDLQTAAASFDSVIDLLDLAADGHVIDIHHPVTQALTGLRSQLPDTLSPSVDTLLKAIHDTRPGSAFPITVPVGKACLHILRHLHTAPH